LRESLRELFAVEVFGLSLPKIINGINNFLDGNAEKISYPLLLVLVTLSLSKHFHLWREEVVDSKTQKKSL
jgi:hypothetical protein